MASGRHAHPVEEDEALQVCEGLAHVRQGRSVKERRRVFLPFGPSRPRELQMSELRAVEGHCPQDGVCDISPC